MPNRNDISQAIIYQSYLGKWVAFVAKNFANNATPTTTIIACAKNKSSLYLHSDVIANGDRIAQMDNDNSNTLAETLIIHYVSPDTQAQNNPIGGLLGIVVP